MISRRTWNKHETDNRIRTEAWMLIYFFSHDNFEFSRWKSMPPHLNHLRETEVMRGHNLCSYAVMWKIIPTLSLYPFLSAALTLACTFTVFRPIWVFPAGAYHKTLLCLIYTVFQIRMGNRNNLGIMIHISPYEHFVTHQPIWTVSLTFLLRNKKNYLRCLLLSEALHKL